jgi:hypothetical protein
VKRERGPEDRQVLEWQVGGGAGSTSRPKRHCGGPETPGIGPLSHLGLDTPGAVSTASRVAGLVRLWGPRDCVCVCVCAMLRGTCVAFPRITTHLSGAL